MKNFVVLLTGDTIGKDAKPLAEKLMSSYLYALAEAEELPTHILFLNTGVALLKKGSATEESLAKIQDRGVKLLACGTCVDYFEIREKISVGQVSNMYAIRDVLAQSGKVITLG